MNGNKLPKKFWDKSYDRTPEGQDEALWACCCGVEGCDGTGAYPKEQASYMLEENILPDWVAVDTYGNIYKPFGSGIIKPLHTRA